MAIVEESIAFLTNFLTQIFAIIATGVLVAKYIITENKKGHALLQKRILGPEGDGKGGILHDMREDYQDQMDALENKMTNKINDSQKELLFEFQKTAMRINYMAKNFGRMERSMQRLTKGGYTPEGSNTDGDYMGSGFYDDIGDKDIGGGGVSADTTNKNRKGKGV